jgi:hypothetical protein
MSASMILLDNRRTNALDGNEMLVLQLTARRERPPKVPVPQDQLPKIDVPPPRQSIQEQLKQALLQQRIQSHYPGRHRSYRTEE